MDVRDAIFGRRAVREYAPDPVDPEILNDLIDAAIHAPSAMNAQPWSFCVIEDKSLLSLISREARAELLKHPLAGIDSSHIREFVGAEDFDIFYGAPVLVLIWATETSRWAAIDCALAAGNLMLAAYGAGLGSCWIGLAEPLLSRAESKALLGIPPHYAVGASIVLGHRAQVHLSPVSRRAPEIRWLDGTGRVSDSVQVG